VRDDKYVVFKKEDIDQFYDGMGEDGVHCGGSAGIFITDLVERVVSDAVVIRRQDVFAPPALDAYANLISATVTLMVDQGAFIPGVDEEPPAVKRLREISEYFHEQAAQSWDTHRKIPD
jgi:hypothetical protein